MRVVNTIVKNLCVAVGQEADAQLGRDLAYIVKAHSTAAAAAGLASGWIPGAGALAAAGIAAASVWSMYIRINAALGITLGDHIMKSIATAVATNLASYFVSGLVLSTAFSFIPGMNFVVSTVLIGGTIFSLTVASGIVYMRVLVDLFEAGIDPASCSEAELKDRAESVADDLDMDSIKKDAKTAYKDQSD